MNIEKELLSKIELLIKISAANLISGKELKEQISLLNTVGLSPKEISELIGTTPNYVSVTLNRFKKKG